MKIEFTKEEISLLIAMVFAIGEDAIEDRDKATYSTLEAKVLKAGYKVMVAATSKGVMDAEILDEEE